jgi:molybdenum cofactor cytidylyltransferase
MRFGPLPVTQALGGVVAHAVRSGGLVLKKGTLIGPAEIAALQAAGVAAVTVAQVEAGDVGEDAAAARIAGAVAGQGVRPLPAAPTCSRKLPACWSWSGRGSTPSTGSTRR